MLGIIEAWGRLELHARGFRAQFARPVALVVFDEDDEGRAERIRRLADAYAADVLEARDGADLIRHCREHDLGFRSPPSRHCSSPCSKPSGGKRGEAG